IVRERAEALHNHLDVWPQAAVPDVAPHRDDLRLAERVLLARLLRQPQAADLRGRLGRPQRQAIAKWHDVVHALSRKSRPRLATRFSAISQGSPAAERDPFCSLTHA